MPGAFGVPPLQSEIPYTVKSYLKLSLSQPGLEFLPLATSPLPRILPPLPLSSKWWDHRYESLCPLLWGHFIIKIKTLNISLFFSNLRSVHVLWRPTVPQLPLLPLAPHCLVLMTGSHFVALASLNFPCRPWTQRDHPPFASLPCSSWQISMIPLQPLQKLNKSLSNIFLWW